MNAAARQLDYSFALDEEAVAVARPPFSYADLYRRHAPRYEIHDAAHRQVGVANSPAGARAAVRSLYTLLDRVPA